MAKKKIVKQEIKNATEAELLKISYSKLEAKFKDLGVESAWVPGGEKIQMVKNAIEKLGVVNKMKEAGIDQEAIDSQLQLKEVEKKEAELAKQVAIEKAKEAAEAKVKQGIVSKDYDLPTLKKILGNIDLNLVAAISTHREILIKKRKVIVDLIEKKTK